MSLGNPEYVSDLVVFLLKVVKEKGSLALIDTVTQPR
jgi:hypothetical protein